MMSVLSVENANNWSWSLILNTIIERLGDYQYTRILWDPDEMADEDAIKSNDIILLQNIDAIKSVEGRNKVICRIGGFLVDEHNPECRYDKELSQVAAIIATNDELFKVGERVNNNTFLIQNGIDLQLFKPRPERQQPYNNGGSGSFVVGFAGNIRGVGMDYKGWHYFTQATLRLRPDVSTHTCLFRHSQVPHDEMPEKFYYKIDCLVLPSIAEGCSNVVMEALACGVPTLLTKVGFHGKRLEDNVNCLFIKRDVDDIIGKIQLLMKTPELRLKLAFEGRLFAENNHNINKIAYEYDRVFKSVLKSEKANKKGVS
jgi:glycosyltransferase involved in cell wall biosynthesis